MVKLEASAVHSKIAKQIKNGVNIATRAIVDTPMSCMARVKYIYYVGS